MFMAEFADGNFEIITADSESKAYDQAWKYEKEHGILFDLYEIDDNYDRKEMI